MQVILNCLEQFCLQLEKILVLLMLIFFQFISKTQKSKFLITNFDISSLTLSLYLFVFCHGYAIFFFQNEIGINNL